VIEVKLKNLLTEKFKEEEFEDCFLVEIKAGVNKKIEVFVDSDSGISFTKCRKISRYLESFIDEKGWLGEKYTLDVSSPGIGRPLTLVRQYKKNVGRKVEVTKIEGQGSKETGILTEVNDNGITVEYKVRIKEGKKKRTEIIQSEISYEDIKKTIVKITF